MTKLRWIIFGLVIGLSGCATQKPQMPDEKYPGFARTWAAIGYCANQGWIDADTAARGRTYVGAAVDTYLFNRDRMAAAITAVGKTSPPSQENCRALAVDVQTRKQQIDNQNATAAIQQKTTQDMINSTKSTQTYCNKIGTQVFCNSY